MVEYAVSDLVKEVKVLLDRNQESAGLLAPSDSDTLSRRCSKNHSFGFS